MNVAAHVLQNYVHGSWTVSSATASVPVHNPSTSEVIAHTPLSSAEDVGRAVQAATAAFREWKETPVSRRAAILFQFKALLERHFDEVCRIITRENGKTWAEAQGDLRRGI